VTTIYEQADLFAEPDDDTITLRWQEFSRKHPYVMSDIIRIAAQAKDRGETRLAMRWIFDSIRREVPRNGEVVALNNDFCAPATRQLQEERKDLASLFRTRRRHT